MPKQTPPVEKPKRTKTPDKRGGLPSTVKILDGIVSCPKCGNRLRLKESAHDLPFLPKPLKPQAKVKYDEAHFEGLGHHEPDSVEILGQKYKICGSKTRSGEWKCLNDPSLNGRCDAQHSGSGTVSGAPPTTGDHSKFSLRDILFPEAAAEQISEYLSLRGLIDVEWLRLERIAGKIKELEESGQDAAAEWAEFDKRSERYDQLTLKQNTLERSYNEEVRKKVETLMVLDFKGALIDMLASLDFEAISADEGWQARLPEKIINGSLHRLGIRLSNRAQSVEHSGVMLPASA